MVKVESPASYVRALHGVDDGGTCISLYTRCVYAREESIHPHERVRTSDVAFAIGSGHTCGETHGNMCRWCSGITHVGVDDARWHDKCFSL